MFTLERNIYEQIIPFTTKKVIITIVCVVIVQILQILAPVSKTCFVIVLQNKLNFLNFLGKKVHCQKAVSHKFTVKKKFRMFSNVSLLKTLLACTIFPSFDYLNGKDQAVTSDISKAFNNVWHAGLLHKFKSYGVSG